MAISDNDILRVTAGLKFQGINDVQNVFYVKAVAVASIPQASLRSDLAAWLETVYDSLVAGLFNTTTFDIIDIFNITDDAPEPSLAWPTLTAGASSGQSLPEGTAALVLGRTGVSKVIGKKYFGVFDESAADDGLWNAGLTANLVLAGAGWITPFTGASGATWDPGVWSRALMLFRVFTEAQVQGVVAYQRRRKRGVGS